MNRFQRTVAKVIDDNKKKEGGGGKGEEGGKKRRGRFNDQCQLRKD